MQGCNCQAVNDSKQVSGLPRACKSPRAELPAWHSSSNILVIFLGSSSLDCLNFTSFACFLKASGNLLVIFSGKTSSLDCLHFTSFSCYLQECQDCKQGYGKAEGAREYVGLCIAFEPQQKLWCCKCEGPSNRLRASRLHNDQAIFNLAHPTYPSNHLKLVC